MKIVQGCLGDFPVFGVRCPVLSTGDLESSRSTLTPASGVPEIEGSGAAGVEMDMSGVLAPPSALSALSLSFLSFLSFLLAFSFSAFSDVPLTFSPEPGLSFPPSVAAGGGVGAADLFPR